MKLKVKRLTKTAKMPYYATKGAACFDISADLYSPTIINSHRPAIIPTGLAFEIPKDHVMLVFSRSGHGFNYDVRLANGTGIIDSDYRGQLLVKLAADQEPFVVRGNDRIAQGMILPVLAVNFEEVAELSETARGNGGFGSTNK